VAVPTATIPQGLGAMTPGPALGALLEAVDLAAIAAPETVSVLVAAYRQLNHAQSVLLSALVEVGLRSPSSGGSDGSGWSASTSGPITRRSLRRADGGTGRAWSPPR
jgi:hypothetical protein